MKKHERLVSFYDIRVESHFRGKKDAEPVGIPTATALQIAKEMKGSGPYIRGNTTLQVALADWKYMPERREHYLIFNRADASLPDIPLVDMRSRATRMAGKSIMEGIDLTAHVLIREPVKPHAPALMLMTAGSSLPVAKAVQSLSQLLREGHKHARHEPHFYREHPSGAKDDKLRLYSEFVVDGHQNATLSDILRSGTLEGLILVSDEDEMLDEETGLLITSTEYRVTPVRQERRFSLASLKAALKKTRTPVDKARIRYKAPGRSDSQEHVFTIAELDAAFVRKDRVVFPEPVQPRYAGVSMMVMDKLRTLN